jgi:hydroxymethylglutaryl-CoA lyase
VVFSALALNRKGVERAIATQIKHLAISLSASNTHSLKNTRKSIEEAKLDIAEAISLAKENGITIRAGVQCVFGCRYEGNIDESVVLSLVEHLLKAGANELALADSTGMANPKQIKLLIEKIVKVTGDVPVALHLHNTENKGYANVFAAVEAGIRHFDTAFGGLGGCPFIKNATGNIATEDTVHMLEQMNYTTGVNIDLVKQVSKEMEQILKKPLPGLLYQLNV